MDWWNQFPSALRLITRARLIASCGAGGVIYLTPLIFNQISFSATQIGSGLAAAALAGTLARLISGWCMDKGTNYSSPVRWAAVIAIIADLILFNANTYNSYMQGQILIGVAAGFYWPAVELAVPSSCLNFPSIKGFALVRSADALGVSLGALIGSIFAWLGLIRSVYLIDIFFMALLLSVLYKKTFKSSNDIKEIRAKESLFINFKKKLNNSKSWLQPIFTLLGLSLLATSILSLLQSALPIDLVKGGLVRPPIKESLSSSLISVQLILLVIFQWPIGKWLSEHDFKYGLKFSFSSFSIGCLLLGLSGIIRNGILVIFFAQLPLACALAAFLPTATEAVISITPNKRRGIAMAMFSQCFAISAFFSPVIAGKIIDSQGHAFTLWIVLGILCLLALPTVNTKISSSKN